MYLHWANVHTQKALRHFPTPPEPPAACTRIRTSPGADFGRGAFSYLTTFCSTIRDEFALLFMVFIDTSSYGSSSMCLWSFVSKRIPR